MTNFAPRNPRARRILALLCSLCCVLAVGCGQAQTETAAPTREAHADRHPETLATTESGEHPIEARDEESTALPTPRPAGRGVIFEDLTEYSHFQIMDRGSMRYLNFVRDNGDVVTESGIDLENPDRLLIDYTRTMFASMLVRPEQERVLIIGLGGGSMVRFMRRYFPQIEITAVEIDGGIVRAAEEYFGVRSGENVDIVTADGFEFLGRPNRPYDVIYMDAFLKPGPATDEEGAPLRMKTVDFLRDLRTHLTEGGVFVVNINVQSDTPEDIAAIREAFPHTYRFQRGGNLIVVGSTAPTEVSLETMEERGRALDARADYGFSFEDLTDRIRAD